MSPPPPPAPAAEQGRVKFYDDQRGFGFITADSGDDLFFGAAALDRAGIDAVGRGDRVAFTRARDREGRPRARDLRVLPAAPASA